MFVAMMKRFAESLAQSRSCGRGVCTRKSEAASSKQSSLPFSKPFLVLVTRSQLGAICSFHLLLFSSLAVSQRKGTYEECLVGRLHH